MLARLGPSQPAQGADVIARAIGVLALMALAVIDVVDLLATLGPVPRWSASVPRDHRGVVRRRRDADRRLHRLVLAAGRAVAVMAMAAYALRPGALLQASWAITVMSGNWRCPLGITALSVETLIILLVLLAAWLGRVLAASAAAQSRKEYHDAHVLT